jgi:hypothetical protein
MVRRGEDRQGPACSGSVMQARQGSVRFVHLRSVSGTAMFGRQGPVRQGVTGMVRQCRYGKVRLVYSPARSGMVGNGLVMQLGNAGPVIKGQFEKSDCLFVLYRQNYEKYATPWTVIGYWPYRLR